MWIKSFENVNMSNEKLKSRRKLNVFNALSYNVELGGPLV